MIQFLYYIQKKIERKKKRRRKVMIITRTRTGFRTKRKKMKQNYTAMYTTCGIICKSYAHINYF